MDFFGTGELIGWLFMATFGIVIAYAVWQLIRVRRNRRPGPVPTRQVGEPSPRSPEPLRRPGA